MRLRVMLFALMVFFLAVAIWKKELMEMGISFGIGLTGGLGIDWLGIEKTRFWHYPRQPFLTAPYFSLVLPAWGVFGVAINLLWNWIENPWVAFPSITTLFFLICELLNLKSRSWVYTAPSWLVVTGWIPLVGIFRVAFLMVS